MPTHNPFEFGTEVAPGRLVDRTEEVRRVRQALESRGRLFVIGPRRYGKTSILATAAHQAERGGATVLRHDAEQFLTLQQLSEALVADAARRLTPTVEKAGEAIRAFFARLQPTASYGMVDQSWSVSLTAPPGADTGRSAMLADVLNGIEAAAERTGKRVGIVVDEFQKVVAEEGLQAERQLRAVVQRHHHVGYVFAGSATRMLTEMTTVPQRPFYRLGESMYVGPLPRPDFTAFLQTAFASGGFSVDDGTAEAILDGAEEVPYNVQRLASACWDALRDAEHPELTPGAVAEVLGRLVQRDGPLYTQIWNQLTAFQQKALLAVAHGGGTGLHSVALLRSLGMGASHMQRALQGLEQKEVVRREELLPREARLRLEDPFFGAWVRGTIPAPG